MAIATAGATTVMARRLWSDSMLRNSVAMMSTTVINSGLGYLFWIFTARSFPAAEVGAVSAVVSAATVASTIADLGLRTALMQDLPRCREPRAWSARVTAAVLVATLTSGVTGGAACLLLSALSPQTRSLLHGGWFTVVILLTFGLTMSTVLDGIATAERRAGQVLVRNIVVSTAKLLLVVVLIGLVHGPSIVVLVATDAALVIGGLVGFSWQAHRVMPAWRPTMAGLGEATGALRASLLRHHLLNLGGWLPPFLLPLEVVHLQSAQQNAYFTFTWMVGNIFFMVSPSVASALFVEARWEPAQLREATRKATSLIAALLMPAALTLTVLGHKILSIFGSEYDRYGYPVLVILIVSALPDAVTNVRIGQLRAEARLAEGARLNLGMAAIAVVVAWVLIPVMGISGAATAWLVAQSAGAVSVAGSSLDRRPRRSTARHVRRSGWRNA